MHKMKILVLLIAATCFLTSCSLGGSRIDILNASNDEKDAADRLEHVIEAINNKEKEAIKALFSKKALDEADDFDVNTDYLLDFIEGTIESWEKPSGPTVFESNERGSKKKEVSSYYYVTTNKQKYFFLLVNYPIDTDNPDNVGIYMLLVVRAEDHDKIYDENNKIIYDKIIENGEAKLVELQHAGIYIPID